MGWMTVVVSRYEVVIQVKDPVALTPIPMSETAVATIVCSITQIPRDQRKIK